jgi:hypothetical protein
VSVKQPGPAQGLLLQIGASMTIAVLGMICLPVIWAQSAFNRGASATSVESKPTIDEITNW